MCTSIDWKLEAEMDWWGKREKRKGISCRKLVWCQSWYMNRTSYESGNLDILFISWLSYSSCALFSRLTFPHPDSSSSSAPQLLHRNRALNRCCGWHPLPRAPLASAIPMASTLSVLIRWQLFNCTLRTLRHCGGKWQRWVWDTEQLLWLRNFRECQFCRGD